MPTPNASGEARGLLRRHSQAVTTAVGTTTTREAASAPYVWFSPIALTRQTRTLRPSGPRTTVAARPAARSRRPTGIAARLRSKDRTHELRAWVHSVTRASTLRRGRIPPATSLCCSLLRNASLTHGLDPRASDHNER